MRYLFFIIIVLVSYSTVDYLLEDSNASTTNDKKIEKQIQHLDLNTLSWPTHWVIEDQLLQGQQFIHFYSENIPEKELSLCLKHFKGLGYDVEGLGKEKEQTALVWVSCKNAKMAITIYPDEKGISGSSIDVLLISKSRKGNI